MVSLYIIGTSILFGGCLLSQLIKDEDKSMNCTIASIIVGGIINLIAVGMCCIA